MNHTGTPRAALAALLLLLGSAGGAAAQQARPFDLSVRNIMRGEGLVGRSPDEVRWSEDSRWVYFRWREPEARDTATRVYRVPAQGGTPQPLNAADDRAAPAINGWWTADRTRRAQERFGDVYVVDATGRERRVTRTPGRERQPHLSRDGRTVYYLADNNVFAMDVDGGTLRQLTDIRLETAPKRDTAKAKEQRAELERDQQELLGVVRDRREDRLNRERTDSLRRELTPVWLGRNASVNTAEVSPSGRYLLLGVSERADGERQALVPNFVTESGYTEPLNVRGKVGDVQSQQRAAMVELATGRVTWIEPEAKERRLTLSTVAWAPRSDRALLIGMPADYKDRWIYVAGPDGKTVTVDHVRDTAWVGGPGAFSAGWANDERVWLVSEKTGWAHLYTVAATGGEARALTSGEWEVTDVQPSRDGRTFYVTTSETHRGERALYAVAEAGGARRRLTSLEGWTEAIVSPDERSVALLHSTANEPPELYVMPNRAGAQARKVTESRTAEFRSGPWIRPEVLTFAARDGAPVYARIYRPRDLGARAHGGAVIFVHGAGYLQNAHRGWSTYYREYMFHHLLAQRGYTVMDVDYRGSAGYGAAVRTGIYRHMGGKDLSDHVDAARWMVANEGVDARRIGIYGGSYGGFITLMAMFTEPETFRSGAALRSVTDWSHYNHPYTARILNLPQEDTLAYRRSSPIYFAEGLKGDLLIAHGMVDTNVHFQDVVRLAQRLIELEKTHWEMAVYPVEDHGFRRPESWADEYRRILELFERTLRPGSPPVGAAGS